MCSDHMRNGRPDVTSRRPWAVPANPRRPCRCGPLRGPHLKSLCALQGRGSGDEGPGASLSLLRPSNSAPVSMVSDLCWMSPCTWAVDMRVMASPSMAPTILAKDEHALADDFASDLAPLADHNLCAGHVALELAVDLQPASADNLYILSCKLQVLANDRLRLTQHVGCPSSSRGSTTHPTRQP